MELNILAPNTKPLLNVEKLWDSVIIGGGPAGYNAALYLVRKGLKPLLIMKNRGGQIALTNDVDNYLGLDLTDGTDMVEKFHTHVSRFNIDILDDIEVQRIDKLDEEFDLLLSNQEKIRTKTVILATGGSHRSLNLEGEKRLEGKGVSYCAICDAPFFKDKEVVVVGGGDSAVEAAIDLSKWATHVHVVQRSVFRADQILLDKMFEIKNITYELGSVIHEIGGQKHVEFVNIFNKETNKTVKRPVGGVFIEIGQDPRSYLVKDLVELNEQNEVIVDKTKQTSLKGLYGAGDVTDAPYKQIITAAADGAIAALSASQYILKTKEN